MLSSPIFQLPSLNLLTMPSTRRFSFLVLAVFLAFALAGQSYAGPPFITDDPEPVEFQHWEIYFATQQYHSAEGWSGTAPHIEINYGVLPDLQLHVIAPYAYVKPADGASHFGYGDTELGFKYRFLHTGKEGSELMLGIFPLIELPTGNSSLGLATARPRCLCPCGFRKHLANGRRMAAAATGSIPDRTTATTGMQDGSYSARLPKLSQPGLKCSSALRIM